MTADNQQSKPNRVAPPDARTVTLAKLLGWDIEAAERLRQELKAIADAEDEAFRITRDVRLRSTQPERNHP